MKIIAIANQKGGVGKTTTAVNLSAGLAMKDLPTLLIDLDMQANTTTAFTDRSKLKVALYDVLIGEENRIPINKAIIQTDIENLDLLASDIRTGKMDKFSGFEELYRLKHSLEKVSDTYEFCVLDCPPNLGNTMTSALVATDYVIIPIKADYFSMEGVSDLLETIHHTKTGNSKLDILGALVTEFDSREIICGQALEAVKKQFGDLKFDIDIRKNTKLRSAPAYKQTIFEHANTSYGAEDYFDLVEEVLERLKVSKDNKLKLVG